MGVVPKILSSCKNIPLDTYTVVVICRLLLDTPQTFNGEYSTSPTLSIKHQECLMGRLTQKVDVTKNVNFVK